MEREIKRVGVLQLGKLFAFMYAVMALLFVPFVLVPAIFAPDNFLSFVPGLLVLVLYPLMGFVGGILCAFFYNISARVVGGVHLTIE